jgi:hypothetical protein
MTERVSAGSQAELGELAEYQDSNKFQKKIV